ncbi:MAG: acetate--CoA ligase family protein [Chloroflexi bacterium]|nr:acetate--CoA ligase family protein [Chloroflexota bacterium]
MTTSTNGLKALLSPSSIAVVGATSKPLAVGERVIRYLTKHGYGGDVFPVNPTYDELAGRKCFPAVLDIPEPVDMAILAVSAERVASVLEQCVQKGVKAAIVFSSGFAESGEEGKIRQDQIRTMAKESGVRICGPNCMGMINVKERIVASFSNVGEVDRLVPGGVGIIAQSGGLAGSIFDRVQSKGLGVSYVVSSGNEADLEACDYIDFMLDDPDTRVIISFIEGIRDGRRFKSIADKALERSKPLVILKAGRTDEARRAAASHTGSMTGSDQVYDALFRQKGVVRVHDLDELVDIACYFSRCSLPRGPRIGIMAPSGGAGVLLVDKCHEVGLKLATPSPQVEEDLRRLMPAFGSVSNPFDPTGQGYGDPEMMRKCLDLFVRDPVYDLVLVQVPTMAGQSAKDWAMDVVEAARNIDSPLVALCTGGNLSAQAFEVFRDSPVPYFTSFESCFRAFAAAVGFQETQARYRLREDTPAVDPMRREKALALLDSSSDRLTEHESKQLLSLYGIPCTREALARTPEEAVAIAEKIGYPVAIKVQSPQISHKTEAGVVRLNIEKPSQLIAEFEGAMERARQWNPNAYIQGILVQEMVPSDREAIVGMTVDSQFGPAIMFGLGGIFAELLRDFSLRVAPLTKIEAQEMIAAIKGYGVLQGARGKPKADVGAITDVLVKVSQLSIELGDRITELDINPLLVFPEGQGVKVVDALVVL